MWNLFNRRKKIRRDQDLKDSLEKAIEEKHSAANEAISKLKQFVPERRSREVPVDLDRRNSVA